MVTYDPSRLIVIVLVCAYCIHVINVKEKIKKIKLNQPTPIVVTVFFWDEKDFSILGLGSGFREENVKCIFFFIFHNIHKCMILPWLYFKFLILCHSWLLRRFFPKKVALKILLTHFLRGKILKNKI